MTTQEQAVRLELCEALPPEVAVGSNVVLRIRVSCPAARDRRGVPINVVSPDGALCAFELATYDGKVNESGNITLKAPLHVGEHRWRIVLPAHEIAGVSHGDHSLPVVMRTKPQETSLAVWSVPSPVVTGAWFAVNVGAKSSADCELKGRDVEIHNASGAVVARGHLGDTPWPGSDALYWTAIELLAPAEEGLCSWSVRFEALELDVPHDGASYTFSVAIVQPPQYKLTVKVIEKDTAAPIEDALVRLGAYRAMTGQSGLAEIRMPKGQYELQVWKVGYDAPSRTLQLDDDVSVQVEAQTVPEGDPDAVWKM